MRTLLLRTGSTYWLAIYMHALDALLSMVGCLRPSWGTRHRVRKLADFLVFWNIITDFVNYRPKDAVAAMIKRLAHRNANVQLYTLEVCRSGPGQGKLLMRDPASECSFPKLRPKNSQGTGLKELHGCCLALGE